MAAQREYLYVTLPTNAKEVRSERVAEFASTELNLLAKDGWEPINVSRASSIGPIGFLLARPRNDE